MEAEFNNLNVKSYNDNNDTAMIFHNNANCQGDDEEQRDNDDVLTENNIPYHSETTVNSTETDAFIEEFKGLFMDNIATVNNEKFIERRFDT